MKEAAGQKVISAMDELQVPVLNLLRVVHYSAYNIYYLFFFKSFKSIPLLKKTEFIRIINLRKMKKRNFAPIKISYFE